MRACVCSLLFFLPGYAAAGRGVEFPRQIDLQGRWAFSLVSGEAEGGSVPEVFPDTVFLPGTTDTNRKGHPLQNREETTFLSRLHSYVGKAWYRRKVSVPKDWRGKDIRFSTGFFLERGRDVYSPVAFEEALPCLLEIGSLDEVVGVFPVVCGLEQPRAQ